MSFGFGAGLVKEWQEMMSSRGVHIPCPGGWGLCVDLAMCLRMGGQRWTCSGIRLFARLVERADGMVLVGVGRKLMLLL